MTYQPDDTIRARFPRLLRAMRWAAVLTEGEAISAIQCHQDGCTYAGEAVNHFGGCRAVLASAFRGRRASRSFFCRQ